MLHYTVILHALLNLIFSFTIAFNNNKIILDVIYIRNVNNNILTWGDLFNILNTFTSLNDQCT